MNYRSYNTFGSNTYTPTYQHKYAYSNASKNYSSRNDNIQQVQYMLENQRKKFRQAKDKYQYDLDNQRKIRIEFENKLIKLKDQFSRKQVTISELQFRINNLLQQNQDIVMENQRLKAELARMEDIYGTKIRQLEASRDMQTRSYQETTLQYNAQFDKFKKQGQQYVQQLTFQFQRKIRNLQQKLKSSQMSKRELSLQVKKLNDILINNKLNFEQQIRDLKNKFRDEQMRKNANLNKTFQSKIRLVEQSKEVLIRKNKQLLKALQDKQSQLDEFGVQIKDQLARVRQDNTQLTQQVNSLNYLIGKLKSQINQKDAMLGRRINDNDGELVMLKNQLNSKRQEINRLVTMNKQIRMSMKQIESDQQRKRRQLAQRCNMWQGQARKYKEQYTRICQVLKSKINDTINNVERRR